MLDSKLNGDAHADAAHGAHADSFHNAEAAHSAVEGTANDNFRDTAIATVATVGVVAVGAVIFEAALLPGLALGVVAALAPQYAPTIGSALNPLLRSTVRGVFKLGQKSREMFAEAQEHMSDIAAEVSAEDAAKASVKAAEPKAAASL
jgi:hypothetical protein